MIKLFVAGLTEDEYDQWRDEFREGVIDHIYNNTVHEIVSNNVIDGDEFENWFGSNERNLGLIESIEASVIFEPYEDYLERVKKYENN